MSKGFFPETKTKSKRQSSGLAHCGKCGLYKDCVSPKMPPTGEGRKKILFIAEAPGAREDEQNIQLIGKAGQFLRRCLKALKIDLDEDCWKTNACICRREENKTPEPYMIEACRPNVFKTIEKYNPNVIVLLGGVAMKSVLGALWKEDLGAVHSWGGFVIPCRKPNAWIVPTVHPSYVLRKNNNLVERLFKQHLKLAVSKHKRKPWKTIPNYEKDIQIITKPAHAAHAISDMLASALPIAFDYETNALKPEIEGSEIVSCSVCWNGTRTISFPWAGKAVDMMSKLLKSPHPKIASNLKFEDRWTRAKLGHGVRNWCYDTMIGAHVLNNQPGITSLKFQAFVLLGQESYDGHIKSFLKGVGKTRLNHIHELDLHDLLLYGGLDSRLEYEVARKQIKRMES